MSENENISSSSSSTANFVNNTITPTDKPVVNNTASGSAGGTASSATPVKSLNDLKQKAPKLYKYMMLSLAQNICISMERGQARLTKLSKEGRSHA